MFFRQLGCPTRGQTSMQHHPTQIAIDMQQFALPQPCQELGCILSKNDTLQVGVNPALFIGATLGNGKQREIMVA